MRQKAPSSMAHSHEFGTVPTGSAEASAEPAAGAMGLLMVHDAEGPVRFGVPFTGTVVVGRDASATLSLRDSRVSRHHATIARERAGFAVFDEGSRNGTAVNGVALSPRAPRVLEVGDVVRFARSLGVVVADLAVASAPFRRDTVLTGGGSLDGVRERLAAVAPSALPVLVEGDTGTGKELAAQLLHAASGRTGPLVPLNCGAVAPSLLESELFGHVRGAFSGADRPRDGVVRRAERGTLFLDEIAELSQAGQAALLRFLDSGEVRAVGDDTARKVDVRVVAATHRPLEQRVASGAFRADLFHRLAACHVRLPPLEARREDIVPLATDFASAAAVSLSWGALEGLLVARWPGNVRQLRSVVAAGALVGGAAGRTVLAPLDLDVPGAREREDSSPAEVSTVVLDAELSRERLVEALDTHRGNISRVAAALGYSRSGLYVAMRRLNVDPAAFRK